MPEPEVLRADNGAVRVLTINRPQAGNAVSVETRATLIGEFEAASGDPTVRAVILTAVGDRHFCTGADLRSPQGAPRPEGVPERIAGDIARGIRVSAQRLIAAILDCEKPVVAAVNGTAAGMGVQVALACDFVLAAESARFIEVYVRRALVPDAGAAYLLPRLIGVHKAKELLMLGDDVSAADALSIGLVSRVIRDEILASEAEALAQRLASGPTRVHALTKWLVNRSLDGGRSASFEDEAIAQDLNMHTADGQEGSGQLRRAPARRATRVGRGRGSREPLTHCRHAGAVLRRAAAGGAARLVARGRRGDVHPGIAAVTGGAATRLPSTRGQRRLPRAEDAPDAVLQVSWAAAAIEPRSSADPAR